MLKNTLVPGPGTTRAHNVSIQQNRALRKRVSVAIQNGGRLMKAGNLI